MTTRNLVVLSALMVAVAFLLQGDTGFNLADEGYLWYGTIQTALGQVPVRDFQSYDPGRYYWGALWFKLLQNDGILALRLSQAVFQFMGLTLGLLLLRRLFGSWISLISAATILVRWMFPTWKIYEPVILVAAIYFAVLLIEQPSRVRHLAAGIFVGLAAFFGRNHGLYCGVAFVLLVLYFGWTSGKRVLGKRFAALTIGIVIGYLPMLLMMALVPGFFTAFVTDILYILKNGTNLPLPVPWPWRHQYQLPGWRESIHRATVGTLFLAFPIFYVFAFVRIFSKRAVRLQPVFIASAFVGVTYLHYTFDRPQLYYLAWTIPPFILGLLALTASFSGQVRSKVTIAKLSVLAVVSIAALEMAQENYFTIKIKSFGKTKLIGRFAGDFTQAMNAQGLVKTDVRGDSLWVLSDTAGMIEDVRAIDQYLIKSDEKILVAPYLPGLYVILGRQSPVWEIYFLLPRALEQEEAMVHDLDSKHVEWALVCNYYMDDRPELQFGSTHGRLWNYLVTNFETVPSNLDRNCGLMHRRSK